MKIELSSFSLSWSKF